MGKPPYEPRFALYSGTGDWRILATGDDARIELKLASLETPIEMDWLIRLNLIYFKLSGADNYASLEKCGPPSSHITDAEFEPLRAALGKVDRIALGFTPISPEARIEVIGTIGETDIELHIYGDTSRTIFFRNLGSAYQWVHEQEIHTGKDSWTDYDAARWEERITVEYQTEERNGIPLNQTWVNYRTRNSMTASWDGLTLDEVQPIIDEWKLWRASQPPSSSSLCP